MIAVDFSLKDKEMDETRPDRDKEFTRIITDAGFEPVEFSMIRQPLRPAKQGSNDQPTVSSIRRFGNNHFYKESYVKNDIFRGYRDEVKRETRDSDVVIQFEIDLWAGKFGVPH